MITHSPGGTIFTGPSVQIYLAMSLRAGLKLHLATGMKPNKNWTLRAMLSEAGKLTGKTYSGRAHTQAMADLSAWIDQAKSEPQP